MERNFFLILKGFTIYKNLKCMRVKLEPDSAFIGKKFGWIFFGLIFTLNLLFFIWFFLFSNLI